MSLGQRLPPVEVEVGRQLRACLLKVVQPVAATSSCISCMVSRYAGLCCLTMPCAEDELSRSPASRAWEVGSALSAAAPGSCRFRDRRCRRVVALKLTRGGRAAALGACRPLGLLVFVVLASAFAEPLGLSRAGARRPLTWSRGVELPAVMAISVMTPAWERALVARLLG